jgi:hypothetical protein
MTLPLMSLEGVVRGDFLEEFLARLRTDRNFREEVRRQILSEDLLELPERFETRMEAVESALQRLAEAQLRTEVRVERLETSMEHFGTRMEAVEAALQRLTEAQARTEEELRWLANWQRGESGRREGERDAHEILRRALALFNGDGGAPTSPRCGSG